MKCLHCGRDNTRVKDTRETPEGLVMRRRYCLSCSHKFKTYEIRTDEYDRLVKFRHEVKQGIYSTMKKYLED